MNIKNNSFVCSIDILMMRIYIRLITVAIQQYNVIIIVVAVFFFQERLSHLFQAVMPSNMHSNCFVTFKLEIFMLYIYICIPYEFLDEYIKRAFACRIQSDKLKGESGRDATALFFVNGACVEYI